MLIRFTSMAAPIRAAFTMTDGQSRIPVNSTGSADGAALDHCPACGHPLGDDPTQATCPVCDHPITAPPLIGEDVSPFAQSDQQGWRAWFSMCLWVYGASRRRLAHLALIRRSDTSTRFFRYSLAVFTLSAILVSVTHFGWHTVRPNESAAPKGKGWVRVVQRADPVRPYSVHVRPTALCWNFALASIVVASTCAVTLLGAWVFLAIVARLAESSLGERFRNQGRFGSALRYGTAWVLFLLVAAVILSLLPLCSAAEVARWSFVPPRSAVYLVSVVAASVGLLLWWFWLIRLGSTVPPTTRSRVGIFFGIAVPLLTVGFVGGSTAAFVLGIRALTPALHLQW